jgi:predicted XRE-type DNA-binding protein
VRNKSRKGIRADFEIGSENVYADLGRRDADTMLVKAQLVGKIAEILKERGLTQVRAAALLGLPQPKLSAMLRGQFRGLSERKLMDCLTLLGRDVDIVVRAAPRRQGAVSVSFA